MPVPNLLFIDTNIWLDFYRARNETGLQLLKHTEAVIDKIVVNFQLESEFKKNRQSAILEGMQQLKAPDSIPRLGVFSDARATKLMHRSNKDIEKRARTLRFRLRRALEKPTQHDPVYKVCQRVFHKKDDLNLTRESVLRHTIRRKAFRRFFQGYPPRKRNDTSIGDAFNWEWMVHCATKAKAGLVIVTRDSDYGVALDGKSYINDHLRQEFSERVSRKRELILHSRLADALKLFKVAVSPQEEEVETEIVSNALAQRISVPSVMKFLESSPATFQSFFGDLDSDAMRQALESLKVTSSVEAIKNAAARYAMAEMSSTATIRSALENWQNATKLPLEGKEAPEKKPEKKKDADKPSQ
jgi:hypothetical protein